MWTVGNDVGGCPHIENGAFYEHWLATIMIEERLVIGGTRACIDCSQLSPVPSQSFLTDRTEGVATRHDAVNIDDQWNRPVTWECEVSSWK